MADHQRIHPVDVENRPPASAPVAPAGLLQSDRKTEELSLLQPASQERSITGPRSADNYLRPPNMKKNKRSCMCKCFCWSLFAIIVLIVLVVVTLGVLYLVFQPKIPKYSVDRLRVANFTIDNSTVAATFDVIITARNPNKKIGIQYKGGGSSLSAWYDDYSLCSGRFPGFYQGHQNTTVLNVTLSGEVQLESQVVSELQQQQQTGSVPLVFRGRVPVRVKLGALKLPKMTFKVRCNLVVDNLSSSSSDISIKSRSCKFSLKL